ncbi:MAG: RNA chaperone Hfq [Clostridia bacterium]|nr:RNA chaperone Hfq [Clostridia bacterium]
MNEIRQNFLEKNKGSSIRLIFANGFQLRGKLLAYDETDMLIETRAYETSPVLIPHNAVSTYVPAGNKF